jgi:hypothetical protein
MKITIFSALLISLCSFQSAFASQYSCLTSDGKTSAVFIFDSKGTPETATVSVNGNELIGSIEDWNYKGADGFFVQFVIGNGSDFMFTGDVKTATGLSGRLNLFDLKDPMSTTPLTCTFL